ncbi:MAG: ATP-binding protein [Microcoleaceae cyanobacterium]
MMEKPVILCVDDELFLLAALEETLKRSFGQEYIVESATTGQEALEFLEELYQDNIEVPVLISDQAMPDMKGVDLFIQAHKQYPNILMIMLTGQANAEDVGKAVNHANLYRYISKPWEEEDLILTVKEAIRSYFQEKTIVETNKTLEQLNLSLEQKVIERTAELEVAKQEAELANQVKSNFLCMMSHELRTPLSAIIGFSQILMADRSLTIEQVKNAEIVYQSGEHLLVLINDVLSMAKIEKGKISLQTIQFNLYRFLEVIQEMMKHQADQKNIELIIEYHSDLPQYIVADETKLRQVLIHLVSNGVKFTTTGGVRLKVTVLAENKENHLQNSWGNQRQILLHFQVQDTGIGIHSELLDALFNPFVQTRTGKTSEGTGLGLPISAELVKLMGGEITVNTEVGKGSTFEFTIPVEISLPLTEDYLLPTLKTVTGLEENQPQYRILILDSAKDYSSTVQTLQDIGLEIKVTHLDQQVIQLWQSWQPHLIFVQDELMNHYTMNFISSSTHFKSILIALVQHHDLSHQANLLFSGFNDILEYPFSVETILQKISQHLGVRYLYSASETLPTQDSEVSEIANCKIEALEMMPLSWVQQFHQGTSQCNQRLLFPLIDQIPTQLDTQRTLLKELIDEFRYDLLLEIANQLLEKY